MSGQIDISAIREAFLYAPASPHVQVMAIVLSCCLLIVVLWLVRQRVLREEYTPLWVSASVSIAVLSLNEDWLRALTVTLGAWSQSSTLFFLGEVFLVTLCLNYAIRLSRYGIKLRALAQECAILRARLDQISRLPGSLLPAGQIADDGKARS